MRSIGQQRSNVEGREGQAALHVKINGERSNGRWRKNQQLFLLEVKHQWTMF